MAADIFTKPFPEAKASTWNSNLQLINIFTPAQSKDIDYHPSMVTSLRGDLDKPKTEPIETAQLSEEDDAVPLKPAALAKLLDECDAGSTVCPSEDDRGIDDFDDDGNDSWRNCEWDSYKDSDWTNDFDVSFTPCDSDIMHECRTQFDSDNSRHLLDRHKDAKPEGALCVFALPLVKTRPATDYWEVVDGQTLTRHHVCPRTKMYTLTNTSLPEGVDRKAITSTRFTKVCFLEDR